MITDIWKEIFHLFLPHEISKGPKSYNFQMTYGKKKSKMQPSPKRNKIISVPLNLCNMEFWHALDTQLTQNQSLFY